MSTAETQAISPLAKFNIRGTEQENDKAIAAAAGHIAGAVATAYLGPVAGALFDEAVAAIAGALLSADDDRFEKEIISRLQIIEQKIDYIINFFNTQFREMVTDIIDKEAIRTLVSNISVDAVKLKAAISVFNSSRHPTDTDAKTLIDAAQNVLGNGLTIFARSKERYLIAIPYFAAALSALIIVRKHAKTTRYLRKYDELPGIWAGEYLKQIEPWLTQGLPKASSFQEVRERTVNELLRAQGLLKDFSIGVPVVYLNLICTIYDAPNPFQPIGLLPNPSGSLAFAAQYVLNEDFSVSVTDLKAYKLVEQVVAPTDDLVAIFGVGAHPAFPVIFGHGGLRNDPNYWNFYSSIYHAFEEAGLSLRDCPGRRDALDFAIRVLLPFSQGLQELRVLNKNGD